MYGISRKNTIREQNSGEGMVVFTATREFTIIFGKLGSGDFCGGDDDDSGSVTDGSKGGIVSTRRGKNNVARMEEVFLTM